MGTKFKSQVCTDRQQSERLLALGLKKETADMVLVPSSRHDGSDVIRVRKSYLMEEDVIPAWSLHRLIEMMPCDVEISGIWIYANRLYEFKEKNNVYDNLIDLLTSIIKEGYFNKKYLV